MKNKIRITIISAIVGVLIISAISYFVFFNTQYYQFDYRYSYETKDFEGRATTGYSTVKYIGNIEEHKPLEYMKVHIIYVTYSGDSTKSKYMYNNLTWEKADRYQTLNLKKDYLIYTKVDISKVEKNLY